MYPGVLAGRCAFQGAQVRRREEECVPELRGEEAAVTSDGGAGRRDS